MSKILHISNTDIELDSRIRKELAALVAISGAEVYVIGVPEAPRSGEDRIDGAHYQKLRLHSRRLSFMPRAVRYCFELIEFTIKTMLHGRRINAEVVHCHDTFALPAGWLLKRSTSSKLVYDAHELESNKNGQTPRLSQATLFIERFCWQQIELLVSVSDSITRWYMQHLGPKPSVLVLNAPVLGTAQAFSTPDSLQQRYFHHRYGIPDDHLIFVYLGILGIGRGIENCLNAFATGPVGTHVVFIGFGPLEADIIEFSHRHPNIHLHPSVPHDQVVSLVAHADYGLCLVENVSLSDYYSLPNKLFEYCFARLPVLASRFPEISQLVDTYSLGMCCDPTPSGIQQALAAIAATRPKYPKMDLSDLSWNTQALRLVTTYQQQLLSTAASH